MASVITHSFVGVALASQLRGVPKTGRFWALAVLLPSIPDADVIGFRLGIQYGDMLGHRGFTHSLVFALFLGALAASTEFRREVRPGSRPWLILASFFALITASHGVLDAMTDGGHGVGFLIPFTGERYFFPFTPIRVSPIGVKAFFSEWGLRVIASELLYVWAPVMALVGSLWLVRRALSRRRASE